MISARPVTAASGRPPPIDLPRDDEVGLHFLVVLDRPYPARPADTRLHLVVHEDDPVLAAQLRKTSREVGRHGDEPALALDGLEHDTCHRLRVDLGLESALERSDRITGRDAAVRVRRRHTVDLGREGAEARLVRLHLAGHRHRQQRATVKGVVEHDHGRPARERARDLHGVLVGLGTGVEEDRLLLAPGARRRLGEPPAHLDVRLVHPDHEALVEVQVGLGVDRLDHRAEAVTGVLAADAAGEVDEGATIDVGDPRAVGGGDHETRGGDAVRHVAGALGEDALV